MTTVKAVYSAGRIKLLEPVPAEGKRDVIVIFLDDAVTGDAALKLDGRKKHAWPSGFFARTAGCLFDTPLRRPSPGKFERRKVVK